MLNISSMVGKGNRKSESMLVALLITGIIFGAAFAFSGIIKPGNTARWLSAGIYLDSIQQEDTGFGKYHLFFRGNKGWSSDNKVVDIPIRGDGTLPLDSGKIEESDTLFEPGGGIYLTIIQPLKLYKFALAHITRAAQMKRSILSAVDFETLPNPVVGLEWPRVKDIYFNDLMGLSEYNKFWFEFNVFWRQTQEPEYCIGGIGITDAWAKTIAEACTREFSCDPFKQVICANRLVHALFQETEREDVCRHYTGAMEKVIPLLDWHGAEITMQKLFLQKNYGVDSCKRCEGHVLNEITIRPKAGPNDNQTYVYAYDGLNWPTAFFPNNTTAKATNSLPIIYEGQQCELRQDEVFLAIIGQSDGSKSEAQENAGFLEFEILLVDKNGDVAPAPKGVIFGIITENGTAFAPEDYEAKYESYYFLPGETFKTIKIKINDDDIPENTEDMIVKLLPKPVGAGLTAFDMAKGVIYDDDGATPTPMPIRLIR